MQVYYNNPKVQQLVWLLDAMQEIDNHLFITKRSGYCSDEGHWVEYRIDTGDFLPLLLTIDRESYSYGSIAINDDFVKEKKKRFFKKLNKMLDDVDAGVRFVRQEEKIYKLVSVV